MARYFNGNGVRLAASVFGGPDAPPVCFFHGGGQSRRAWDVAARAIARHGFYALSFDLRGHGESDWAADGDYLLEAYARDVASLIDQFDQRVTLVGASRGGQAALAGAALRQDKVRLVMLADVTPLIEQDGVDAMRAFFHASADGFTTVDDGADALARILDRPRSHDNKGLRRAMREYQGRLYWRWDPRTVAPEFLNPPSESETMIAAADAMRRPVVLIKAEHSNLVTPGSVAHFRSLVPHLIVEEATGAHHMLTGDDNAAFAARLLHHLQATAR